MGFVSPEQVKTAQLGEPLRVFMVRLDALIAYKTDADSATLVQDAHKLLFPVTVDQQVVSSLTVTQRSDGWRATDFGDSALTKALVAHREGKDDFIVWVPAMKIYFDARGQGATLTLTPIIDDSRFEFRSGEALAGSRAFAALQRAASGYNGLPQ